MEHYINNKIFLEQLNDYKEKIKSAEDDGREIPPIPDDIAISFMKIANGLGNKPNFSNYTYKDEMISDGIENCIQYCRNFDSNKSKNPFSYFTQIIYYAFLRRIEKEKKQAYVKYKLTEATVTSDTYLLNEEADTDGARIYDNPAMDDFEEFLNKKRESRRKKVNSLEEFME
tara:strand:+ start:376 stop:891 length:516 start_codon:yes stop_codon:yes gene_type:complete